ncbi:MAG: hypothetical protein U5K37_05220 [Natrialbaceae archaeon]|nr:hypothetical protein [Natrialbaceae archaeon]
MPIMTHGTAPPTAANAYGDRKIGHRDNIAHNQQQHGPTDSLVSLRNASAINATVGMRHLASLFGHAHQESGGGHQTETCQTVEINTK